MKVQIEIEREDAFRLNDILEREVGRYSEFSVKDMSFEKHSELSACRRVVEQINQAVWDTEEVMA